MTQDGNAYQGLTPERKLQQFLFEAERFMTSIIGYSRVLSMEVQNCDLPPKFVGNLEMLQTAAERLSKTREELAESMK